MYNLTMYGIVMYELRCTNYDVRCKELRWTLYELGITMLENELARTLHWLLYILLLIQPVQ